MLINPFSLLLFLQLSLSLSLFLISASYVPLKKICSLFRLKCSSPTMEKLCNGILQLVGLSYLRIKLIAQTRSYIGRNSYMFYILCKGCLLFRNINGNLRIYVFAILLAVSLPQIICSLLLVDHC